MPEKKPLHPQHEVPTDPNLKNGPVQDRSCTDILCLLIFILFSVGMCIVAGLAFKSGDPQKLAQPYDPDHRACGVDPGVKDYPFIYFANPTSPQYLYVTTCVMECPNQNVGPQPSTSSNPAASTSSSAQASRLLHQHNGHVELATEIIHQDNANELKCATNSIVTSCKENANPATMAIHPGSVVIIYNSLPFMGKVCLPVSKDYFQQISSKINVGQFEEYFNDIKTTKWVIFGSILVALVVSFLFIFLIEKAAGVIVWLFIIASLALLLTGSICSYTYYLALTNPDKLPAEAKAQLNTQQMQQNAYSDNTNPNSYLYLAFFLGGLFLLFFILLICFFGRIRLAVAILKTAGDFVGGNPMIILLPLITLIILIGYFAVWVVIALYLYSMGTVSNLPHQLPFGQFQFTQEQKIIGNYHLFGLFWNQAFIIATVEFIIAGAVCEWYFQQGGEQQYASNPTRVAIARFFKYHMGSVALGSFLLAVIMFIRFWMEYIYHNSAELRKKNKVLEIAMDCCRCYMWCFEKCVQFINKNAYIGINMTGKTFCQAAIDAVGLIVRNFIRFGIVAGLGEVFVAIGRLFISLATGLACYFIIIKSSHFQGQVQHPEAPAILCGIVGFTIGKVKVKQFDKGSNCMAIYGVACDALIFVFCMDEEIEQATGKPVQCPPKLRAFSEMHMPDKQ